MHTMVQTTLTDALNEVLSVSSGFFYEILFVHFNEK